MITKSNFGFLPGQLPPFPATAFWVICVIVSLSWDSQVVFQAVCQIRSFWYQPVDAVLDQFEFRKVRRGRERTIEAIVNYRYRVDGKEYISQRFYFFHGVLHEKTARSWLPEFNVGEKLTAFYDSQAPERSVLVAGMRGLDFLRILRLIPVNAVAAFGFINLFDWLMTKWRRRPSIEFRKREWGNEIEFRFYKYSPLLSAVFVAGFAGLFLVIFVTLFFKLGLWIGIDRVPVISLCLVFGSFLFTYMRSARYYAELIVDRRNQQVTLDPSAFHTGKKEASQRVTLDNPPELDIVSNDSFEGTPKRYSIELCLPEERKGELQKAFRRGRSKRHVALYEFWKREEADQMVQWMCRFGFSFGKHVGACESLDE